MKDDVPLEAKDLPGGFTPIWVVVPEGTTHKDILEKLSELREIGNRSVTVLHKDDRSDGAANYCDQHNWNYRDLCQMWGCEDEVIIAINALYPEAISRAHNLLVVVTSAGHK